MRSSSGPEIRPRYLLICPALQWHKPFSSPNWPQGQGFIALLHFVPIKLESLKLKETDFEPRTLGEHVRRRRLEMKLTQKEVAAQFGVVSWTILNWEKGHTEPPIGSIPGIIRLLGYDPFPGPNTLSEHLLAKRREMGWAIEQAARTLGVDPSTWRNWEGGQTILYRQHRVVVARLLGLSVDAIDREMASRWNRVHKRTL
jgi:transcriptional regulator with XRE-family HTH domain